MCADAATIVSGQISGDTTWTKENSPYIIAQPTVVWGGVTLTLKPGVVIKPLNSLYVEGKITAEGTAEDPVVYTSMNDRAYGGDTGGYVSGFSNASSGPIIVASNHNGKLNLSLSDGSMIQHYMWISRVGGGNGWSNETVLDDGHIGISYGTPMEAIITGPQIDGQCSSPSYTGNIDTDFACAIAYAKANGVVMHKYVFADPAEGDWSSALSLDGSANLSHFMMRYGGSIRSMLILYQADATITDSTFSDATRTIDVENGSVLSVDNTLFRNVGTAVSVHAASPTVSVRDSSFVSTDIALDAVPPIGFISDLGRNWWGDPGGPKTIDIGCGGSWVYNQDRFFPWLKSSPDIGATSSEEVTSNTAVTTDRVRVPVLIVPGILGSMEWGGSWVIDPILHTYDNLIDTLLANGYVASSTLFTFPYDWRNSNVYTASLLKQKIAAITASQRCPKVDIVAHSMGGLVAQAYLASAGYAHDIRNIAFLGVPRQGAPEDYSAWEAGELGSSIFDRVLDFALNIYAIEQGFRSAFDYIRGFPVSSVQELLPTYSYLRDASASSTGMLAFPDGYPRNSFLENMPTLSDLMRLPMDIINVVGDGSTSTIVSLDVDRSNMSTSSGAEWPEGKIVRPEYGAGDGTVPIASADEPDFTSDTMIHSLHTELPTASESLIVQFLRSGSFGMHYASTTVSKPLIKRILLATVHSPVDVEVVSPTGQAVGRDGQSGEDVATIPGSFYSGASSTVQIISIPDPESGQYTLETQGKGSGDYTVEIHDVSDATSSVQQFTGTASPGSVSVTTFDVSAASSTDATSSTPAESSETDSASGNAPKPSAVLSAPETITRKSQKIDDVDGAAGPWISLGVAPEDFADAYVKESEKGTGAAEPAQNADRSKQVADQPEMQISFDPFDPHGQAVGIMDKVETFIGKIVAWLQRKR